MSMVVMVVSVTVGIVVCGLGLTGAWKLAHSRAKGSKSTVKDVVMSVYLVIVTVLSVLALAIPLKEVIEKVF